MEAAGISSMLGAMYIAIRGDMTQLPGDLEEAGKFIKTKFSLSSLAGGFLEIGKASLAAYAPVALLEKGFEAWHHNAEEGTHLAQEFSAATRRLNATLQATGNTTGFSAETLKAFALEMDESLATSATGIMEFQARLSQFQRVQGEVFTRATDIAVDWAELWGEEIPGKARVLGMALNDPIRGISLLRRANIQLTDAQKKQIESLVKQNDVVKAQEIILGALEKKFGGAAKAMLTPTKILQSDLETALRHLGDIEKKMKPMSLKIQVAFVKAQTGAMSEIDKMFGFLWNGASSGGDAAGHKYEVAGKFGARAATYGAFGASAGLLGGPFAEVTAPTGAAAGVAVAFAHTLAEEFFDEFVIGQGAADARGAGLDRKLLELKKKGIGQGPGGPFDPIRVNDKAQGIFDPMALYKTIQQSLLDKDDKMLGLMESGNGIQQQILDTLQDGSLNDPIHGGGG